MKNIFIRGLMLLILSLVISYFISGLFYNQIYSLFYGTSSSLFITYEGIAKFLIVYALSYIFFISIFFSAFAKEGKYWFIGILLIPAAAFELYFDASHIYFPIILGLVGWLIGLGISKLARKI